MNDKLSELADKLIVHEVMEGSDEELYSIIDECEDYLLVMLWDHEPSLPNMPDTSSNKHEWVCIKESVKQSIEINASWRAFTYECRKCGSKIMVPASEDDLSLYGAPTCNECLVSDVMNK